MSAGWQHSEKSVTSPKLPNASRETVTILHRLHFTSTLKRMATLVKVCVCGGTVFNSVHTVAKLRYFAHWAPSPEVPVCHAVDTFAVLQHLVQQLLQHCQELQPACQALMGLAVL